ncbi:Centrosomal protein [Wickerhamomyces ciferrii]|uniref:Centrosomal protein n=1 Tax=Wickerhamomyces ciferrii (strain ATCC 14091 / BCRC 22168 / CBS 111 / JCM 3599 / NBRC 0793 / NRRL Y-1031 F-60-10) TaxID=1206466 RepID=K0KRX6_WICCF|nr:Centrosomal protein [Wickerhamomyces ciferrii]CCH44747.1 Centrosomal protein [Wickerhamomyces ciferrii]
MSDEHKTPNKSYDSTYLGSTQKKTAQRPFSRRTWDISPRPPSSPFRRLADSARKQSPGSGVSSPLRRTPAKKDDGKTDELMNWIASIKHRASTALEEDEEDERSFYERIEKEKRQVEAQNQINTEAFEKLGLLLDKEQTTLKSESKFSNISNLEKESSESEEESEENDSLYNEGSANDEEPANYHYEEEQYPKNINTQEEPVEVMSLDSEEDEEEGEFQEEEQDDFDEEQGSDNYREGEQQDQNVDNQSEGYDSEGNVIFPDDSQLLQLPSDSEHEIGEDEEIEIPKYDDNVFAEDSKNEYVVTPQYQSAYSHSRSQPQATYQYQEHDEVDEKEDQQDNQGDYDEDFSQEEDYENQEQEQEQEVVDLSDVDGEDEYDDDLEDDNDSFNDQKDIQEDATHHREPNSDNDQPTQYQFQENTDGSQENQFFSFDMLASAALNQIPHEQSTHRTMTERVVDIDDEADVLEEDPQDDEDENVLQEAPEDDDDEEDVLQEDPEEDNEEEEDNQDQYSGETYYREEEPSTEQDQEVQYEQHSDAGYESENQDYEPSEHHEVEDIYSDNDSVNEEVVADHHEDEVLDHENQQININEQEETTPSQESEEIIEDNDQEVSEKLDLEEQENSPEPEQEQEPKVEVYEEEQYYDSDNEPFKSPSHSLFGSLTVDEVSAIQDDEDEELVYGGVTYNTNSILANIEHDTGFEKDEQEENDPENELDLKDEDGLEGNDDVDRKERNDQIVEKDYNTKEEISQEEKLPESKDVEIEETPRTITSKSSFASFSNFGGINNNSTISFKDASLEFEKSLSNKKDSDVTDVNNEDKGTYPKTVEFDLPDKSDVDIKSGSEENEENEEQKGNQNNQLEEVRGVVSSMLEQSLGENPESFIEHAKKGQEELVETVNKTTPAESLKEIADNMIRKSLGEEPEHLVESVIEDSSLKDTADEVVNKSLGEEPKEFVENRLNALANADEEENAAKSLSDESERLIYKVGEGLDKLNAAAQANKDNEGEVFSKNISEVADELISEAGDVTKEHIDSKKIEEAAAHDDSIFSESIPDVAKDLINDVKNLQNDNISDQKEEFDNNRNSAIVNTAKAVTDAVSDVVEKAKEEVEEAIESSVIEPENALDVDNSFNEALKVTDDPDKTESQEINKNDKPAFDFAIPDIIRDSYLQGLKVAQQIQEQGENFVEEPAKPKLNMSFYNKDNEPDNSLGASNEAIAGSSSEQMSPEEKPKPDHIANNYESVKAGIESLQKEDSNSSVNKKRKLEETELEESEPTGIFHKIRRFASFTNFSLSPKKSSPKELLDEGGSLNQNSVTKSKEEAKNIFKAVETLTEENIEEPVSKETEHQATGINLPQAVEDFAKFTEEKVNEAVIEPVNSASASPSPRGENESLIDITEEAENFVSFVEDQVEEFIDNSVTETEINRDEDEQEVEFKVPAEVKKLATFIQDKVDEAIENQVAGEDINRSSEETEIKVPQVPQELHDLAESFTEKVEEAVENEVEGEDVNRSTDEIEIKIPEEVKEVAGVLENTVEEALENPVQGLEHEDDILETSQKSESNDINSGASGDVEEDDVQVNDDSNIIDNDLVNSFKDKVEEAVENPIEGEVDDKDGDNEDAVSEKKPTEESSFFSTIAEDAKEVLEKAGDIVEETIENPLTTEEVNRDEDEIELEIPQEVENIANDLHEQVEEVIENPLTESEINRDDTENEANLSSEVSNLVTNVKEEAENLLNFAENTIDEAIDAPVDEGIDSTHDIPDEKGEGEITEGPDQQIVENEDAGNIENKEQEEDDDDQEKKEDDDQEVELEGEKGKEEEEGEEAEEVEERDTLEARDPSTEVQEDEASDVSKDTPVKPPSSKFEFSQIPPQQPYRSPFKRAIDFIFRRGTNERSSTLKSSVILKNEAEDKDVEEPAKKRQKIQSSNDFHDHIIMKTRSGKIVGANTEADIEDAKALEKREDELIDRIAHGKVHTEHAVHDIAAEHERIEEHHDLEGNHIKLGDLKSDQVEQEIVEKEEEIENTEREEETENTEREETPVPQFEVKIEEAKFPNTPKRRTRGRSSKRSRTDVDDSEEPEEKKEESVTPKRKARSKTKSRSRKELPPKSERKLRSRTK